MDETKFRQMAKEANYSDDEIESYLASQKKNATTGQAFGEASTEKVNTEAQKMRDAGSPVPGTETPAVQPSTLQQFFNFVKTPLGTAAAGAAGIGASEFVRRRMKSTPDIQEAPRVEPTLVIPETQPVAPQELPKPTFPQSQVQQPAVSGYGQQTLNAPTGVPNVAAPNAPVAPPAGATPQPVDPLQAARIRKAEADAAIAEHKLQQLQNPVKTAPAAKKGTVSESDLGMVQSSGAAATQKKQATEMAKFETELAAIPDPIQATSTPAEKQAAVATVEKSKPESVVKKPKAAIPPGMTKEEFGMMNHLLGTYGGKEEPMAMKAYEQVKDILGYTPAYPKGQGGSLTADETGKILGWRKESIPGPKVNLTHEMKGVLKKGGPAAIAAMILTPEFAKASTAEKRQIIGESLLPIGLTPGELAPGTLTEKQLKAYENSQKLGSPYRSVPPPR